MFNKITHQPVFTCLHALLWVLIHWRYWLIQSTELNIHAVPMSAANRPVSIVSRCILFTTYCALTNDRYTLSRSAYSQ